MLITRAFLHLFTHLLFFLIGYLLAKEFRRHQDQHHQLMEQNDSRHLKVTEKCNSVRTFCLEEDQGSHKERNRREFCFYFCTSNNSTYIFTHTYPHSTGPHHTRDKSYFYNPIKFKEYFMKDKRFSIPSEYEPVTPHLFQNDISLLSTIVRNKVPLPFITSSNSIAKIYQKELHKPRKLSVGIKAYVQTYSRTGELLVPLENETVLSYLCEHFNCICYENVNKLFLKDSNFKHEFSHRNVILLYLKELNTCETSYSMNEEFFDERMLIQKCNTSPNFERRHIEDEISPTNLAAKLRKVFFDDVNMKTVNKNRKKSKLAKYEINSMLEAAESYVRESKRISHKLRHRNLKLDSFPKQINTSKETQSGFANKTEIREKWSKNISKLKYLLSTHTLRKRRQALSHAKDRSFWEKSGRKNRKSPKEISHNPFNFVPKSTSSLEPKELEQRSTSTANTSTNSLRSVNSFKRNESILKHPSQWSHNRNIAHKNYFDAKLSNFNTNFSLKSNNPDQSRTKLQKNQTANSLAKIFLLRSVRNLSTTIPVAETNSSSILDFRLMSKDLLQQKSDKTSDPEFDYNVDFEDMIDFPTSIKAHDSSTLQGNSEEVKRTHSHVSVKEPLRSELKNEFDKSHSNLGLSDKLMEKAKTDNVLKNMNDFIHSSEIVSAAEDVSVQDMNFLSVNKEYSSDISLNTDAYKKDKKAEKETTTDEFQTNYNHMNSVPNVEILSLDSQNPTDINLYDKKAKMFTSIKPSEEVFMTDNKMLTTNDKRNSFTTNSFELSSFGKSLTTVETHEKSTIQNSFPFQTDLKDLTEKEMDTSESNFKKQDENVFTTFPLHKQSSKPTIIEPKLPSEISKATSESTDKILGDEYRTSRNEGHLNIGLNLGTEPFESNLGISKNSDATREISDKSLGEEYWRKENEDNLITVLNLGTVISKTNFPSETSMATSENFDSSHGNEYRTKRNDDDLITSLNLGTAEFEPNIPSETSVVRSGASTKELGEEFQTNIIEEELIRTTNLGTAILEPNPPSEISDATSKTSEESLGDDYLSTKINEEDLLSTSNLGMTIFELNLPTENSKDSPDNNLGDEFWTKRIDDDLTTFLNLGTTLNEPSVTAYVNERSDKSLGTDYWTLTNDDGLISSLHPGTGFTEFSSENGAQSTDAKINTGSKIPEELTVSVADEISKTYGSISVPPVELSEPNEVISIKTDYGTIYTENKGESASEEEIFTDLSTSVKFPINTSPDLQLATKQSKNFENGFASLRTERDVNINTDIFNLQEDTEQSEFNNDKATETEIKLYTKNTEIDKTVEKDIEAITEMHKTLSTEEFLSLIPEKNTEYSGFRDEESPSIGSDISSLKTPKNELIQFDGVDFSGQATFTIKNDFSNLFSSTRNSATSKEDQELSPKSGLSTSFMDDKDKSYFGTDLSLSTNDFQSKTDLTESFNEDFTKLKIATAKINSETDKPSTERLSPDSSNDFPSKKDLTESVNEDFTKLKIATAKINSEADEPSTERLPPDSFPSTFLVDNTMKPQSSESSYSVLTEQLDEVTSDDEIIFTTFSDFVSEDVEVTNKIVKTEESLSREDYSTNGKSKVTSISTGTIVENVEKTFTVDANAYYPTTNTVTFIDLISTESFPIVSSITDSENDVISEIPTNKQDSTLVEIMTSIDNDIIPSEKELVSSTAGDITTNNGEKVSETISLLQTDGIVSSEKEVLLDEEGITLKDKITTVKEEEDEEVTQYNIQTLSKSDENTFVSNNDIKVENKISEGTEKEFSLSSETDLLVQITDNEVTELSNDITSIKENNDVFPSTEVSTKYLSDLTSDSLTNSAVNTIESAISSSSEDEMSLEDEKNIELSDSEVPISTKEADSFYTDNISIQLDETTTSLVKDITTEIIKEGSSPDGRAAATQDDKDIDLSSDEILIRTDRDVFSSSDKDMSLSDDETINPMTEDKVKTESDNEMPLSFSTSGGSLVPGDTEIDLPDNKDAGGVISTEKDIPTYEEDKELFQGDISTDLNDDDEETTYSVDELIRTEREILPSSQDTDSSLIVPTENEDSIIPSSEIGLDSGITGMGGTSDLSFTGGAGVNVNINTDVSTEFNFKTSSKVVPLNPNSDISTEINIQKNTIPEIFLSPTAPKSPTADGTDGDSKSETESSDRQSTVSSTTEALETLSIKDVKTSESSLSTISTSKAPESTTDTSTASSTVSSSTASSTTSSITDSSTTSTSTDSSTTSTSRDSSTTSTSTPRSTTSSSTSSSTTSSSIPEKTSPVAVSTSRTTDTSGLLRVDGTSSSADETTMPETSTIPFHFTIDADYDEIVGTRKEEFEESLTKQLVVAMRIPTECLQNLKVTKGSIEVNFELAPNSQHGHMADEKALKAAADELKRMIDNGQLNLNDLDGNTLVIVPMDPPTKAPVVNQTEQTTVILGVVIGAFVITVISVAIAAIVIKRKNNGTQRLSPIEEVRSKLPSYREIPFQEALFVKGCPKNKLMMGKYCYNTGQWMGPGPEPVPYQAPDSVVYRPPTDTEIRQTPRPPTAVRERLKNDWELDWDSMVYSR